MTPERPRHFAFLSRLRRLAQLTPLLLTVALLLCGPLQAQAANLPTGGSVAAGSASIGTATGTSLTVTQTSASAVLNWQSFSVGQGYSVNFVQPSSSSTILNRVTGSATSVIAGSINANGHVYLINPNGIVITATGTVNTGAFVASTLGISDADFMAGKRTFTGNEASAAVSNAGSITIGRGGYAALLGGAVDNAGTIVVPLGKVGLGAGEQATLDLSGDGFLQVAIPTTATGTGALVANSGRILADGGLVMLSAAAAKDMARQAINMSGAIEAKSVSGVSGDIVLAGSDGAVDVSGKIDATSADTTGGSITVTGRAITLTGASLDASGASGGGSVKIGGDWQGTGTLAHADTLTVDAASTITADATSTGNGGDVVLWSDDLTTFAGTISATGGAISGNGGQAEVSGKKLLAYTGFTNLSAAHGSFGTLLLDPYNVTISSSGTSGFTASSNDSVINATTLLTALGSANVTVSTGSGGGQSGDITVAAPLSWSSGSTLTLTAAGSIAVNANITIAGSGGLALNYGGALSFASGKSASFASGQSGQSLTINGAGYTLLYSMAAIDAIDSTGLAGKYALANSLVATGTTYTDALVGTGSGTAFTGTFEGLGNTITGLTIAKSGDYAGLFGYVESGGVVRDLGLIGGSVSGKTYVGGLAGYNVGTISNAYATGAISGNAYVGGLVGTNAGTISNAYATGAVSRGSFLVGGLVGSNRGTISNAYATGAVSGTIYVGGLAGSNVGTISIAYATGTVSGSESVGGLVGENSSSTATIINAYATGAVSGSESVGGLVGENSSTATIINTYATGAVSGSTYVGGLAGKNAGEIRYAFWDTTTSGQNSGIGQGDDNHTVFGRTTTLLQTVAPATYLGTAFSGSTGLYPYLTSFFPSGVQTVSGYAYTDSGTTPLKSSSSGAGLVYVRLGDGSVITTTTGANGYYYAFAAKGSIDTTSGSSVLAYTLANANTGATDAATYTTRATDSLTGVKVYGNTLTQTADSTVSTLSALDTAYATATSGTTASGRSITNRTITALATDFTLNTPISASGAVSVAADHNLTIAAAGSVSGADVSLQASGAFINQSGADAVSATNRWLIYSANSNGDTFGGLDSGNIAIWSTAAGATVSASGNRYVFAVQPTVTVTTTDASKTYGDTADVSANYTVTGAVNGVSGAYLGVAASGILSGALASGGSAATADVGGYSYTQGTLAVTSGYVLGLVNTGTLTVTARSITVTADAQSRTYGDANPGLTYLVGGSGLVNGDTLTGNLATAATSASDAGGYAITQGTLTNANNSNYAITYVGNTLTITARPITVTANAASSVYGDTPNLTYNLTSGNLVGSDTLSGSLASTGTSSSDVGSYSITQGTLAASSNYAVSYVGANLTITARPITITANAASSAYGDTPSLTYVVGGSGLVNHDTLSGSLATSATTTSAAGSTHAITQGTLAASTNYTVTYASATLTITQRPITVTANAASSVYGDTPNLTYTVGGSGLVNGDTLSGSLTSGTSASDVGSYAISQGTLGASTNYTVSYVGAMLTITARPITVTANALSSYHGFAIPALTYTVGGSGLVNGDTLSGSLATTATSTSPNGTYAITQGSVQASANYTLTFVQGLLTVKTVTLSDTSVLPSSVERSWRLNTAGAGPAAPTDTLTVTFGGNGGGNERGDEVIFSSPRFDGLAICPGGDCAARPLAQRL
jgi:filamentous hemagglutinin family protein